MEALHHFGTVPAPTPDGRPQGSEAGNLPSFSPVQGAAAWIRGVGPTLLGQLLHPAAESGAGAEHGCPAGPSTWVDVHSVTLKCSSNSQPGDATLASTVFQVFQLEQGRRDCSGCLQVRGQLMIKVSGAGEESCAAREVHAGPCPRFVLPTSGGGGAAEAPPAS